VYDSETGQLLTGSYNDYVIPRADDLPCIEIGHKETLCPHNPLSAKSCGEAGAIAAPAAVINAVVDALEPFGITHMPATPERVWRTIRGPVCSGG
jgi:carbon-monoxide dehydrogenase large subunit